MKLKTMIVAVSVAAMIAVGVSQATDTTGQGWNEYHTISVTVTNGSSLGLINPHMTVTPSGQVANGTNTVTLKTPYPFTFPVIITIPSTATNCLRIAEGATFQKSGGIVLTPGTTTNTVVIQPCATNIAVSLN